MNDPTLDRLYKPVLVKFISFLDGIEYPRDTTFPLERLSAITAEDVVRWLKLKAWGDENPAPGALPLSTRSNTLMQHKKSISYYMPQQSIGWNPLTLTGNPTRSREVRDLIQYVKKKEVRNQGKNSQARRALVDVEFLATLEKLNSTNDVRKQFMIPACMKMQFHLIARIDDACHMVWRELKPHPHFTFALLVRMRWSKNVMEERDAPQQIVLGARDPKYCVLLALGIYGEINALTGALREDSEFLFGHTAVATRNKMYIASTLGSIWSDAGFERTGGDDPIGSHSIRKYSTTKARQSGCGKDDVEDRARWRRQNRVSNRYTDIELPYPDAKVAASLAIGGPVKYSVREGAPVTRDWLFEHVIPNLVRVKGNALSPDVLWVLGLPVLWACFEVSMVGYIPDNVRQRVRESYGQLEGGDIAINPVIRIDLAITGQEGELNITEIVPDEEIANALAAEGGGGGGGGGGGRARAYTDEQFRILYSLLQNFKHEVIEAFSTNRLQQQRNHQHTNERIRMLHLMSRRYFNEPVRRLGQREVREHPGEEEEGVNHPLPTMDPRARLSSHPRTLYDLWNEFAFGLNGNKAARLFSPVERGRVKCTYCRRMVIWRIQDAMIRAGHTVQTACDTILSVYGENLSVSRIIECIKDDKRNGVRRAELRYE